MEVPSKSFTADTLEKALGNGQTGSSNGNLSNILKEVTNATKEVNNLLQNWKAIKGFVNPVTTEAVDAQAKHEKGIAQGTQQTMKRAVIAVHEKDANNHLKLVIGQMLDMFSETETVGQLRDKINKNWNNQSMEKTVGEFLRKHTEIIFQ